MKHTSIKAIFFITISSLIGGVGQLLWKKASFSLVFNLSFLFNPYLITGVLFYFIAILFMILSYREGELSILYPILATSYLWVSFLSPFIFITETLSFNKIIGSLIIFFGVVFVGLGGNYNGRH
ncbi:hypothetical protein GF386_01910 [Candidatus Pacearchaeota archaeon]|nr:hypothetical protein [Candidatus Pacearchaeota archaeon]